MCIRDSAKEAKKYYTSKNYDGTIVSYENQKMKKNFLDSPGNCDITSHVCIETLINDAETLGFNTDGITKQGEALLALGLAERLYGIQKEFKENLSNALLRREALLRLVDPVCLGNFKWFVFNKFKEKKMNINSTCLRRFANDRVLRIIYRKNSHINPPSYLSLIHISEPTRPY